MLEQCTGPTAGIPLGGYITTAAWAVQHPATARAFQRAVEEGQALAATDRAAVEKILQSHMPISKGTAALVNLNVSRSVRTQGAAAGGGPHASGRHAG